MKKRRWRSPTKEKIILLLAAGVALSFARTPGRQLRILKQAAREWRKIKRRTLYRLIREFKDDKLIDWQERDDGTIKIVLTERGREKNVQLNFDRLEIKRPAAWDGRWRLVFFDIPEKKRRARDALREKLKELGFLEWQKSVFVHPFPCRDEVEFIIEFFDIRPYVRFGELINLVHEAELKLHFDLT